MCDLEANVACRGGSGSGPTSDACLEAGVGITGDRPSADGCEFFVQCTAGVSEGPFKCPIGTLFNPEFNVCDLASAVTCADASTTPAPAQGDGIPSVGSEVNPFAPRQSFRDRLFLSLNLNQ